MGKSSHVHKTSNNHPMNAIKVSKPMFSGARNSFQVVSRGLLALHCGKYANYQEKITFDKLKTFLQ